MEFDVDESFAGANVAVGVDISHLRRRDLELRLTAPDGTTSIVFENDGNGGDENDHFRATFYGQSSGDSDPSNDLNADPEDSVSLRDTPYRRLIRQGGGTNLSNFYAGSVNGTWVLRICDGRSNVNGSGEVNPPVDSSSVNSSRLTLINSNGDATTVCEGLSSFDWGPDGSNGQPFTSETAGNVLVSQGLTSGEAGSNVDGVEDSLPSFFRNTAILGGHAGVYRMQMNIDLPNPPGTGTNEAGAIEYSEFLFSAPVRGLQFTILDPDRAGTFEDMARIEGFGLEGERVAYQRDLIGTDLQVAGDWTEGDSSAADGEDDANVIVHFDGPVTRVRYTYAQGNDQTDSAVQYTGLSDFNFCSSDYGDAPSSYESMNVASHLLAYRDLYLGSAPPFGELAAASSADALGDNLGGLGEIEDGATALPVAGGTPVQFTCGAHTAAVGRYCREVTYTNNQGIPAQLAGWVDFNGNGVFDANERSLPNLAIGSGGAVDGTFTTGNIAPNSSGTAILLWDIPGGIAGATLNLSYLRLRITTDPSFFSDASPQPTGQVRDGEIEDFTVAAGSLPVTLARVESVRLSAEQVRVDFGTATHAGTMGFQVLQADESGALRALTRQWLLTEDISSTKPADYSVGVDTRSSEPLWIEELAVNGRRERFGPYPIGVSSGARLQLQPAAWPQGRAELTASRAGEDQRRRDRARGADAVEVQVDQAGLQRIDFADLVAAGYDWSGTAASGLQLAHAG
ncbi:MAG: proprotein convertase P-domain-containing protein, partial [Myxococcales bacterium]|nr:proprotein convertase P-domain-containing protein [Myxococcales bacterium]